MREKHNALIFDTETTMMNEKPFLAYHIGGCFGNVYSDKSKPLMFEYYVEELIANPKNFEHTFVDKETGERKFWKYDSRYAPVLADAWKHKDKVKPFAEIIEIFSAYLDCADSVASYNWAFDKQAIKKTVLELQHVDYKDIDSVPAWCVMDCYATRMINHHYFNMVDNLPEHERLQFKSKSGKNYGYSAECMARWIFDAHYYTEQHTALDDAKLEYDLARHFVRKHRQEWNTHFLGKPKTVSWRKIRDKLSGAEKMRQRV